MPADPDPDNQPHSQPDDQGDQDEPRRSGAEDDEWDSLVLDETFVREADAQEPAARTRMLSERWKREAPAPQPWRSDQPPAGWALGTSRRQGRTGRTGRPRRRWFRRKRPGGAGE